MCKRLIVLLMGLASFGASADVWQEREALQRLSSQLNRLEQLAIQAQVAADPDRRVQMDYAALLADMRGIQSKIDHYLNTPLTVYQPQAPVAQR